jgi:3-isopropylmalate dehydrogenase
VAAPEGTGVARIAVLAGDGVGPEVIAHGARLLEELSRRRGLGLALEPWPYGADHYLATGETLPDERFRALARGDYAAVLFGAVGDPRVPDGRHAREILLGLRARLDLYVNLRPVRLLHERLTPLKGKGRREIDLVIFRENTEGLYTGAGGALRQGTEHELALEEDVNTWRGVTRILRAALEWARAHGKRRVCMSDKSNAMRHAGALWQRRWRELGAEYPELELRHLYVDALCLELVRAPEQFEVIVTGNLFGDIASDVGAAIAGGMGVAASANLNPESGLGLFEPVHGSAPALAGKDLANPLATFLTCALLLDHLGHAAEARLVEAAVERAAAEGRLTPDCGGALGTRAAADFVVAEVLRGC